MALPSLSFVLGVLALLYLSTFVFFAVLRVLTGVSIQRLGLSSIRHVAYTPRDGLKLEVRGLGLKIHRPTFAQPTWLSLVITELKVTLDLAAIGANPSKPTNPPGPANEGDQTAVEGKDASPRKAKGQEGGTKQGKIWRKLTEVKNRIKRVQNIIPWLRLLDLVAERSSCIVIGVGTIHVGSVLLSVDTRRSTVDRSRLFQHTRSQSDEQRPAEWTLSTRSVLFTPHGEESAEILDNMVLNIHGFLHQNIEGLRDASVSLKLGRLHMPYDSLIRCSLRTKEGLRNMESERRNSTISELDNQDAAEAPNLEASLPPALLDATDFIASTLHGIRQVSVAVGFLGVSKRVQSVRPGGGHLYINASMQELGIDLYRLDPSTPAHSMYFARAEVAHQALISAISISVGIDDTHAHPQRLVYIPMATATIKTTLPAKMLQFSEEKGSIDLNSNIFFANLVMTSPSIDLDPQHLPLVLATLRKSSVQSTGKRKGSRALAIQLLPRASIKLSVHEPVIRVSLPPVEPKRPGDFDFDLLISAVSFISLDIDSSHTFTTEDHYNASFNLRIASHRLYYQTTSRQTHDLLVTDTMGLKAQVNTAPTLMVIASASLQTFSVFMIRPEISEGIRQIVHQLRKDVKADKKQHTPKSAQKPSSLRTLPTWLHHFELQASDFNIEVAAVDAKLSHVPRGFAVHLDSWSSEYKVHKDEDSKKATTRRRGDSNATVVEDGITRPLSPEPRLRQPTTTSDATDGRRVAFHLKGFEAYVIQSFTTWESEPCISLPHGEVALTTSNDGHGPVLHVNSHIHGIFVQYSLFKHYAISVAVVMLHKTFTRSHTSLPDRKPDLDAKTESSTKDAGSGTLSPPSSDFMVIDLRTSFVQVKAHLPDDPRVMFHLEGVQASRHRWTTPYVRSRIVRLHAAHPTMKQAWSRVVSIKNPRVDFRDVRKKNSTGSVSERSMDIVAEALRIGVHHQLIVHKIFDNFINTAKTVAQLHHRFKTDSDEYILAKVPEGPKHVPKISLRIHMVLFEIEDGAFEWKLGAIFRTGLVEQKQRLAREAAFDVKCQRIRGSCSKQMSSHFRSTSENSRYRKKDASHDVRGRGKEQGNSRPSSRHRSTSRSKKSQRNMRYDRDGTHGISSNTQTTIDEALKKLQIYNARSWRTRIDNTLKFHSSSVQDIRSVLWGSDDIVDDMGQNETILQIPSRPALISILMSDLTMNLDGPSFPLSQLPDFMHRVGKGIPRDMEYSLLIPMHTHFDVGELQINLRDYPLPLLHIPAIKPGQSPRLPSWSLKTNFIIAEEFRDWESTRDLEIMVIPPDKMDPDKKTGGFAIDVRRTVSPVKTYSDMKLEINTARDTRITWGTSYQPAIQDMMQVIEGFSKPQVDPSDKVGFWDKIRLAFHSRVSVTWTGGGDVYLMLKGSRDPYIVTGHGAGFVMIWRNNVQWNLWQEDDPTKFMTVESGDYVLAIPDFSPYARRSPELVAGQARGQDRSSNDDAQTFKKVIMKLSGKVRWQAGLVFERNVDGEHRSFEFEPHYNVTLKNPVHLKKLQEKSSYDAFRGFRSNHIHMSVGVSAPSDREWTATNLKPSSNYNSVHLSPRFFTHFFDWWRLFSGIMSLPIRQGPLFPNVEKSGKKFGRHIATVKYSLLLSPMFISHVYIHKDAEEFSDDVLSATGLKVRLDSLVLDLHQRREEFKNEVKGMNKPVTTTAIRINQALLDLVNADMRAVSVRMVGTSLDTVNRASAEKVRTMSSLGPIDLKNFTIPDSDYSWIDVDDFVEVDWTLPYDQSLKTWILPMVYAPRFTYRRQTDHNNLIAGNPNRHSPFGHEPTHSCVMSSRNDSRQVQIELLEQRMERLEGLMKQHARAIGDLELRIIREVEDKSALEKQLAENKQHGDNLEQKKIFMKSMLQNLYTQGEEGEPQAVTSSEEQSLHSEESAKDAEANKHNSHKRSDKAKNASGIDDYIGDFSNRFVVHNAQIKWNNPLRNTMLRYIHQVTQRRGFVYYTSRRAVKFILDIIEEQNKSKMQTASTTSESGENDYPEAQLSNDDEREVQDRVEQLLNDGKKFVNADDSENADGARKANGAHKANEGVAHDFVSQNNYHVRLVAPQIQLQSEKNPKAVVLLTARGMRLKVFEIMDKDHVADEVSGLVQTRFSLEMDNIQFFVTTKQSLSSKYLSFYSGNNYGIPAGSSWPPWAPMEAMFHFTGSSYGFSRVVQRTSASIRYDKYNKLRLKYNDNVNDASRDQQNLESRMDHFWVDFPQLRAICDSTQYYAMYIIVLDLLMWNEPLEKIRNERLEKIMLASDFSDLRGTPEMVIMLQERIRQLEEIKIHFHINEKYLDRQGWQDRFAMEEDLASCEDELFFIMKAITTSQRRYDDRVEGAQANGVLRYFISASEIVWHLTKEADQPLAEFQLGNASFERTDNSDGSNFNSVEIDQIQGLSLLPNAMYPQTIMAYTEHLGAKERADVVRMLRVNWYQLEAIAGINVVDHFEVNLHPVQIQLEYDTGRKLFEYIFPGAGAGEEGFSPFMIKHQLPQGEADEEDEDEIVAAARNESLTHALNNQPSGSATGVGNLENRLQPTRVLTEYRSTSGSKSKSYGLGITSGESSQRFKLFTHTDNSKISIDTSQKKLGAKTSLDNISISSRKEIRRSGSTHELDKKRRFTFQRSSSKRSTSADSKKSKTAVKKSDDLSQMLNRASNYMTLSYVKIPSVVLCLSYKGKGNRNFEDVHNLVFRMPTLEYRNKTWSNLDLALALKKDVIRALISHTGTIISNKFHHKPGRLQQSRLRELVSSSVVLNSADASRAQSSASSSKDLIQQTGEISPNQSFETDSPDGMAEMQRTESFASGFSSTSEAPDIEVWSPGGTATTPDSRHDFPPHDTAEDLTPSASAQQRDHPGGRSVLTRHFSELTHRASGKRRDTSTSDEQQPSQHAEETTPKRQMFVKKILHSLDRSS